MPFRLQEGTEHKSKQQRSIRACRSERISFAAHYLPCRYVTTAQSYGASYVVSCHCTRRSFRLYQLVCPCEGFAYWKEKNNDDVLNLSVPISISVTNESKAQSSRVTDLGKSRTISALKGANCEYEYQYCRIVLTLVRTVRTVYKSIAKDACSARHVRIVIQTRCASILYPGGWTLRTQPGLGGGENSGGS